MYRINRFCMGITQYTDNEISNLKSSGCQGSSGIRIYVFIAFRMNYIQQHMQNTPCSSGHENAGSPRNQSIPRSIIAFDGIGWAGPSSHALISCRKTWGWLSHKELIPPKNSSSLSMVRKSAFCVLSFVATYTFKTV